VAQKCIVNGKDLEIADLTIENTGETCYLCINRFDVLTTAKEEMSALKVDDFRKTIEVSFYGELAKDHGGPRKEFFRLCLQDIENKFFKNGLREELAKDYEFIGTIIALSLLQNGPIFHFCNEILEILFDKSKQNVSVCIENLRVGLNKIGIVDLCQDLPILLHLFRSSTSILTRKSLVELLVPQFSPPLLVATEGNMKLKYTHF